MEVNEQERLSTGNIKKLKLKLEEILKGGFQF
jgi:hypothetical protein